MSGLSRSWLVGVFLGLLAGGGTVKAQTPIEARHTTKTLPKSDLGKPVSRIAGANGRMLTAGTTPTGVGGKVIFKRGETTIRYPSTDLSLTTDSRQGTSVAASPPQGGERAIMPPVSAEESQRARSSRVFPSNLNEGVSLGGSAATNGLLKATGITGDTNARGPASIAELARSLKNDPDLIYQYVRNNIEFYPIFGVQKGALGAVLDNQGTAYDQAMLMVELLRASSIPANFVSGYITLNAKDAAAWYGVDTSNACAFANLLAQAQLPFQELIATATGQCPGLSAALVSVTVEHVWVKARIGGEWFVFDPSFKTHTIKTGIDFARQNPAGYNASTYWGMAQAPSTDSADWVQNIGRTNIRDNLTSYATNLANYLRKNNPTATLDDVIGGKTIDPFYGSIRQTALPYRDARWPTAEFADVPNSVKPTVRIQYQGIDQTFTSDAIYGRRLTITYANQGQAMLKLDGSGAAPYAGNPVAAGTPTTITFTVSHNAYASPSSNQTFSQTLVAGGTNTYLITNSWGPTGRGAAENYRGTISDLRASGTADTSEPLLGSTLALIGAQWIAQSDQAGHVTAQLAKSVTLVQHRVGIVGYVNNAYVDLPANVLSIASTVGDAAAESAAFASSVMHFSILESAAVEQTTGVSAVSTVKLVDIAAAAGQRIYNGTSSRFASFVQPNLVNCGKQLPAMTAAIAAGQRIITPARCDITENNWSGAGYFVVGSGLHMGAFISDGLSGGYSTKPQPAAQTNVNANNNQPVPTKLAAPVFTYGDPIDMVQGNFVYDHDDVSAGADTSPGSLTFRRLYNSGTRYTNGTLGKGWTHNFNITAATGSDGFQALGERSALDAVGTVMEQKVSLDLLMDPVRPLGKIVAAALGQRWFGDQLINNTVIITQGLDGEVFVKLPDGTYNPAPGRSAKLTKNVDGTFSYELLNRGLLKFNTAGKAESYADPSGIQVKYYYGSGTDIAQVENSLGNKLLFSYSGGRIVSVANGPGSQGSGLGVVGYNYDANGNLSTFTDALGRKTTYTYSLPGRIASVFYPSFPTVAAVTNSYDTLGRVQRQINARGKVYNYFFAGSRTEEVGPGDVRRINYIDGQGNIVQASTPLFNYTVNTYDGQSRLIRTERPEGNAVEYTYDDASCSGSEKRCTHNVKTASQVRVAGSGTVPLTRSFTYESAFNKVASATDANGNVTRYTYTAQGLPLTVTSPTDTTGAAPVTTYSYSSYAPVGFVPFYLPTSVAVKTTANNEVVTATAYDPNGRFQPKAITVDAGAGRLNLVTSFSYDRFGYVESVQNPRLRPRYFEYDAAGRVIETWDTGNLETRTSYDEDGRPTTTAKKMDQQSLQWMVTCTRYSATGRRVRVWGPALTGSPSACPTEAAPVAITDTAYDDLDRPTLVTQYLTAAEGGNRVTQTLYNADDTVQTLKRAVGTALAQPYMSFEYSENGNVEAVLDAKDNATMYTYDAYDRRVRTHYPHPTSPGYGNLDDYEENTYDANGNVTAMRKRNGKSVLQTWDKLNRVVGRTYPNAEESLQFAYDLRGLRTETRYTSGAHSDTYVWDNVGRLIRAAADGRTLSYQYDASGNRTRLTWPDGFFVTTDYDSLDRPVLLKDSGNNYLANYFYDMLDRRVAVNWQNGAVTAYQYNSQGSMSGMGLTFSAPTSSNVQYTYSRNQLGELTGTSWNNELYQWKGAVTGSRTYVTNGLNQYKSQVGSSYAYDANGNASLIDNSFNTYDLGNRLKKVGRGNAALEYDPEGRLQRTIIAGVTTDLLYDGTDLIAEYDASGALQQRYVHGPGTDEPIVSYEGDGTTARTWMIADNLGSIVATTDASGYATNTFSYGPFGETDSWVDGPRFRYTGQQYFARSGLYYYKARFYSPTMGRFLQTDPAGTKDDLNLYAYVGNNPVNRVDPTGLAKVAVGDAIQVAGKTPNEGAAGSWYTNPGSGQMRLYGNDGKRAVDLDFDHDHGQGVPHAHNYSINPLGGPLIRGPGLPFSILP